jgi:hypothetical protein
MMSTVLRVRVWWVLTALSACLGWAVVSWGQDAAAAKPGILTREQAAAIMPATVFYRGQSATIQGRNSSGIRMAGGKLMLAAVVDTGGYSTAVQQSYQAYLITEIPLDFDGKILPPGAYGFGFVAANRMVVMDVGANQIFEAKTQRDAVMARPNPLQILPDAAPGHYRLYMGRTYVVLAPQGKM